MHLHPEATLRPKGRSLRPIPMLIFGSRWLQLPLYIGLIVAQGVYVVLFLKELWHLFAHSFDFSEQQIMLAVLGLIDVVMISNLLVMVIVGGYETFVSRLNLQGHPDEPEWLSHVNASVLKIKLAMAIIGISSIHLLRTFIEAGGLASGKTGYTETGVMWQTIIHTVFILSAIGIAYVDKLSNGAIEAAKQPARIDAVPLSEFTASDGHDRIDHGHMRYRHVSNHCGWNAADCRWLAASGACCRRPPAPPTPPSPSSSPRCGRKRRRPASRARRSMPRPAASSRITNCPI